jgi:hypothetical protein
MLNFFNDTFGLLFIIDLGGLRFGYKIIFAIIGHEAKLNYFKWHGIIYTVRCNKIKF